MLLHTGYLRTSLFEIPPFQFSYSMKLQIYCALSTSTEYVPSYVLNPLSFSSLCRVSTHLASKHKNHVLVSQQGPY